MSSKKISDEERALFQDAMKGVTPLHQKKTIRKKTDITPDIYPIDFIENPIFLSDAYHDAVDSETPLVFLNPSLSKKQLKALKDGTLHFSHTLDLHGMTGDEAKTRLIAFLQNAFREETRAFLLIHGKGGRDGKPPVLKNLVNHWLRQIPEVLSFHSAKPKDGGSGALYVLLKKSTRTINDCTFHK